MTKKILLDILDNFTESDFERFKSLLKDEKMDGIKPITVSQLEKAEKWNVVDLMVQKYGPTGAVKVMQSLLKAMGRDDEAKKLDVNSGAEGDSQKGGSSHQQGQRFVDRHRRALIDRVTDINTILDQLLDRGIISDENYDTVRAVKTTQDQMREILKLLKTVKGKDALYEIMKETKHLSFLIAELEKSE